MKNRLIIAISVLCCWIAAASGQIFFRLGSEIADCYLLFFILGNLTCLFTTGTTMIIYGRMKNVNIASLLISGGAFVAGQTAMLICFRSQLTVWQIVGIFMIIAGISMGTLVKEKTE